MNLKNSKTISILGKMEREEFNDFSKYIRCKYHNQRQKVVKLFDFCKRFYPNFEQVKFSKEAAFKKLYPSENFNVKKINNTLFHLNELLNDYLIFQEMKRSKRAKQYLMMNALERKTLDKLLYKHLDNWETELEQTKIKESWVYQDLQEINFRRFTYINYDKRRLTDTTFQKALTYSDYHFVTEKIRLHLLTTVRHQLLNQSLELRLTDVANNYLKKYTFDNPMIEIYQRLHHLLHTSDEANYLVCKDLILNALNSNCSQKEKQQWLELLLNFGMKEMSLGKKQYRRYNLDIMQIALPLQLFHQNKILPESHFINTVAMAQHYPNEHEWLIDFIKKYQYDLIANKREAIILLAYANLNFAQQNYEEVISSLYQVDLFHFDMNLMARTISIKAMTEMELLTSNYHSTLLNACEAHIKFIKRHNELPIRRRDTNLNFISSLKLILKNKGQYMNSEMRQRLIEQIKATPSFGQEWLVSIIQKL